ncbi:transcriptional regulator, GntR family [Cognatiyoonia koreensis]|uniref:Transcriptional regulator, GntR family n=1 Tax=Cognatiyoonia koreensis TaxID=364200 RepID=A0A1I0MR14_9RHOB|nr:GntR family transcriptional regulator [Cognatiyoonia koreensis]SEV91024.1 transcriptional regulator, GntR family [Cognatiyoonia koreensis]
MTPAGSKSKPNSTIAVDKLRALIFSGELGAGTDHLESELATKLGMSRTPVREAVLILESQGLLEVRPRKGVRITPVSPGDMAEIYDVLTELESLAAADAARRGYTKADLGRLARSIDAMELALARDDRTEWAKSDERFHSELVRLGGNSRVQIIAAMMSDQVRRARMVTLYMRPAPDQSNADHRGVFEAISRGEAEAARNIHRAHRMNAKRILIALLAKHHLNAL